MELFNCFPMYENATIKFCFSQRRKKKAEDVVGIKLPHQNSLAIPGQMGIDDDDNDDAPLGSRPTTASPKRSPNCPKTPMVKRRSIDQGKSFDLGQIHPPGYIPGGNIPRKQRASLAPKQKAAKMDVARAMGIMGFNSSRWLEASQVNLVRYIFRGRIGGVFKITNLLL